MIKFFGEPLKEILSKNTHKVLFRFDTKGEFVTDDPEIIKRAMGFFDYLPMKATPDGERVKKTFVETPMTITVKGAAVEKQAEKQEPQQTEQPKETLKCKKCDFETDNKGLLMAHYREMHPKIKE